MRLALLLILFPFVLKAQQPLIRDYWLNEAATPVKVNAILQDKTGYIWLGTDEGLICYDGANFIKIPDSLHVPITAIATADNIIWTGYANGKIGIVTDQKIAQLNISNAPASAINNLQVTSSSHVLMACTEDGVFAILSGAAVKIDETRGLSDNFTYSLCNYENHVLVGSDRGISDISIAQNKLQIQCITSQQGLPDNIVRVIKQIPGSDMCWIGTQQNGIVLYNAHSKKIASSISDKWQWGQINDIVCVSKTRAWIATDDGHLVEIKLNGDTIGTITPYYYEGRSFRKLLLDAAGNIWCGTNKGLTLMTGEYLYSIKLNAPYTLHDVTAMVIENDTLFMALENRLFAVSVQAPSATLKQVFKAGTSITSLYVDQHDRLWIGTWNDGMFYKEPHSAVVSVTSVPALLHGSIINIAGTDKNLWVASMNGVEQLTYPDDGHPISSVMHHGKRSGIGSDYVYQLYPDHNNNIWMATDGAGVCMYDGHQYHHWDSFASSNSKVVYTMTEDTFGDMWAGVLYKDIYHLHKNHWENLRRHETQYVDINISSVLANATGQVISVSQRCIDEWYPKSRYFRHFNSAMRVGIDSTSNVLNCIAKDKSGNVYVPYQHGILIFKDQDRTYDIQPSVHIMHVSLFLKPIDKDKHKFNHDENYLSFYFGGISFSNPERLNYRYMLEGYNNEWVITRDGSVTYPRLPAGNYTFRVQTSLNSGYDHALEDSYSFTISKPFWRTIWFYILITIVCLGLIYLYVKIRERRMSKILQLKQERMKFEYEHLKSQINPHFLFNSLNTLASLIEENKENAIDYTVHLSDLYRYILAYPDKDLILLTEECEILDNYVHIQKSRFGSALDIRINIPEEIKNTKMIVPLALQMLVENAIKHNVVSNTQPLVISIIAKNDEIVVTNAINPKISTEKKSGLGLVNIVKRYKLLTERQVTYGIVEHKFVVTLPLL